MTVRRGWLDASEAGGALHLRPGGRWDVRTIGPLERRLRGIAARRAAAVHVDLSALEALDTAGALLLSRARREWEARGLAVTLTGARPQQQTLLDGVSAGEPALAEAPPSTGGAVALLARIGGAVIETGRGIGDLLAFLGELVIVLGRTAMQPRRLRVVPLLFHLEQVGLNAMPIVGLISFLIGIVLAFQGASQLQRFGAEVFVVNLLAISLLREIAILLTAIVVAGRSGSAFTAQIGSMKVNEEVDAMRTLGLDPMETLVVPRLLALVIALPLLAFYADIMGLIGGGLMAWLALDIPPGAFIERLNATTTMATFWVGIVKAPVFGFIIAMVGCFEGLQVAGSAESLGRRTTRSVVEAIFLVIVLDAVFSIFFQIIGV